MTTGERRRGMTPTMSRIAVNPLQWVTWMAGARSAQAPDGGDRFADPAFLPVLRDILREVRASGFENVMLKVPPTQTLPSYGAMVRDAGLGLAPGYVQLTLPEDEGLSLSRGSLAWFRRFDAVRRRAEESLHFGLESVFVACDIRQSGHVRVDRAVAVGADYDEDRLERVAELLSDAVDVLAAEGLRAGLHNHVGTWVETEHEIDVVLDRVPALHAGFDVGHLAWAGIDPVAMVGRYADRVLDLHVKDLDLDVAARTRATPTTYQDASGQGLFRELGLGDVDLAGVLAALPGDFAGWIVVEVDRATMPPLASARQSLDWLRRHGVPSARG